jgi:hypothetical protein
MVDLVDPRKIEEIVGTVRQDFDHVVRASVKGVFILHSRMCVETRGTLEIDLRECPYSQALANGVYPEDWLYDEDRPTITAIQDGRLVPAIPRSKEQS